MSDRAIALPPLNKWRQPPDLPVSHQAVFGLVKIDSDQFVAQVTFVGNDFMFEFLLGHRSVHVSHWLPIAVDES